MGSQPVTLIVVLAMSRMFLLSADTCRALLDAPTEPAGPDPGPQHEMSFRLSVHARGPAFHIVVRSAGSPNVLNKLTHLGDIEVSRCSDGRRVQTLPVFAWNQFPVSSFHTQDINFDGYLDIAVYAASGAKWVSESWWVFDPALGEFVQNQLTRQLQELKYNGYKVDPRRREISALYFPNFLNPGGCGDVSDRYRVENNVLALVHHEETRKVTASKCEVVVSDRINGAMRVTSVRQFTATAMGTFPGWESDRARWVRNPGSGITRRQADFDSPPASSGCGQSIRVRCIQHRPG
jgi:hypothetical protein